MTPTDTRSLRDLKGRIDHLRGNVLKAFDEAGATFDVSRIKVFDGSPSEKLAKLREADREMGDLQALVEARVDLVGTRLPGKGSDSRPRRKSAGAQFAETFNRDAMGTQATKVDVRPEDLGIGVKATIGLDPASPGVDTGVGYDPPTITGIVADIAEQPPTLAEWVPTINVDKMYARYLEETVASNTSAETDEGEALPEATLSLEQIVENLRRVGITLPVTDEVLDDDFSVAGYIDRRLGLFTRERIDQQLLQGDGTRPDLQGFHATPGINNSTYVAAGATAQTKIAAMLDGAGKVATEGKAVADTVVIEAAEWWSLLAARDNNGEFIFDPGSPPTSLFGLRPIVTTQETPGRYLVGAVRGHSALFARNVTEIKVEASRDHNDFFIRNQLMLRIALPCWLAVLRPAAFTEVTGA